MRRYLVAVAVLLAGACTLAQAADFRVTLLGTDVPNPHPERMSQSMRVEAGAQRLVFDVVRGTAARQWPLRIPMGSINAHFITHYHSDHTSAIPDLWLTGWLRPRYAQRKTPFVIHGPEGAEQLMAGLQTAHADDIKIRLEDEKNPPEGIAVDAREFQAASLPQVVYAQDGVKVTAFEVDHGNVVRPSVDYRIDYDGRSVVISGGTRLNDEVVRQGTRASLLIHEVAAIKPELLQSSDAFQRICAHHVLPEQAGQVSAQTKPDMAVYSHIARYDSGQIPAPNDTGTVAQTCKTCDGPLVVGTDLMQFDIDERGSVAMWMATASNKGPQGGRS